MKKNNQKKSLLTTSLLHSAVLLTSLLVVAPLDATAAPDNNGVAPVNPLNPAETVQPTSPPPDSFSKPERKRNSKETNSSNSASNDSSEKQKTTTDTHTTSKKKKKKSKLKTVSELSSYPLGNEGTVLESQPNIGGGSSGFIGENTTQSGQTLARLSGILLYGRKYKA